MYGFISNNLKVQINKYLENKLINVEYKYTTPIKEIGNIIEEINVDILIVDSTCFFEDQLVTEFCYQLKIIKPQIRPIVICFNNLLITEIAMLGIYDIIDFQKKINLSNELDEILLNPKTLSNLQQYLNIDIIKNKNSLCKIYGAISYSSNCYLSTFVLNYAQYFQDKKICICEFDQDKNGMEHFFKTSNMATITSFNSEKYKFNNCEILFTNIIEQDQLLTLMLNLKSKFEIVICDIGKINFSELQKHIINSCDELLIFKSANIFNDYTTYDELISSYNKEIRTIDYKKLYDSKIIDIESNVIKKYINENLQVDEKEHEIIKDLKTAFNKIKVHIEKNKST